MVVCTGRRLVGRGDGHWIEFLPKPRWRSLVLTEELLAVPPALLAVVPKQTAQINMKHPSKRENLACCTQVVPPVVPALYGHIKGEETESRFLLCRSVRRPQELALAVLLALLATATPQDCKRNEHDANDLTFSSLICPRRS